MGAGRGVGFVEETGVEQTFDEFEGREGGAALFFVAEFSDMEGELDVCEVGTGFFDCNIGSSQLGNSVWDGEG